MSRDIRSGSLLSIGVLSDSQLEEAMHNPKTKWSLVSRMLDLEKNHAPTAAIRTEIARLRKAYNKISAEYVCFQH